jgi:hypothetical protein
LLAAGKDLEEIISLYSNDAIRRTIFADNKKSQEHAIRFWNFDNDRLETNHLFHWTDFIEKDDWKKKLNAAIDGISHNLITPRYSKTGIKELLYQVLSKNINGALVPLQLGDCKKDIMITVRDMQRNETTFFTAFHMLNERQGEGLSSRVPVVPRPSLSLPAALGGQPASVITGTFKDVYLKDAIEASASAPTYFSPRGRFIDGGVSCHNNPAYMAAVEALHFSNKIGDSTFLKPKYVPYSERDGVRSGTVLWSFGTAYKIPSLSEGNDIAYHLSGSISLKKRTDNIAFWIEQIIDQLMFSATQEQDYLCRNFLKDIKYMRYNLAISESSLIANDFPVEGQWQMKDYVNSIKLDAVGSDDFRRMDHIAKKFAEKAYNAGFGVDGFAGYELRELKPDREQYRNEILRAFANYE